MEHFQKKFLAVILLLLMFSALNRCGKSPTDLPPELQGFLKVFAVVDTLVVDSMNVNIDNDSLGIQGCPFVIGPVIAGKHQVAVSKVDPQSPINYTCTPQLVEVPANDTAEVDFSLTKLAPNFTLKNLDNQDVELQSLQGKVVLLIFYSHT